MCWPISATTVVWGEDGEDEERRKFRSRKGGWIVGKAAGERENTTLFLGRMWWSWSAQ